MGVPRLVFPLQWQRRKRWRGMDRNGLRCTRGDRQTVVEFLGIIEITISRQGDREESIRPDGNFEIHRAEIFQFESMVFLAYVRVCVRVEIQFQLFFSP